jgi:hypothetical protein
VIALSDGRVRIAKAEGRPFGVQGSVFRCRLDDGVPAPLRAYLLRIPARASSELGFLHKGPELVAVAGGLVQVVLATGRPVLRQGESLLAERSGISSIRNLGDADATVFWILRDPQGPTEQ